MYRCCVFVFEPIEEFAAKIAQRFVQNPAISVYHFGLASENQMTAAAVSADATSMFKTGGKMREMQLIKASEFLKEHQVEQIDLMKINIEGGEYDLLEHLIDSG